MVEIFNQMTLTYEENEAYKKALQESIDRNSLSIIDAIQFVVNWLKTECQMIEPGQVFGYEVTGLNMFGEIVQTFKGRTLKQR